MKYTFRYNNEIEKEEIMNINTDKILIEEQNISEGNYLIFSDNPSEDSKRVINIIVPEHELIDLKNRTSEVESVIFDAIMGGKL